MRQVPGVIRAAVTIDKTTLKVDPHIMDRILSQLRDQLCREIAHVNLSRKEDAFSTTFRADVVALSPDDFWRIVQEEAIIMGYRMSMET
jgi:hypothetical protein